ncbi:LysR family transcriptional regulator (plasmid) [Phaeobacter inhibens]|uniref:LysR family transcriptional regulator n=1 Tax=Phaeobacter inhibens TaxID=221822 RepID=UPI0001633152|nr:LysR family transcriptional regulator [Phaeobacter inhibens]AFO93380.1 transcriptional regulator, LysR family [Phaeobacter inhibens DSM 17395]AUQ48083.1 transcriptional regulator TdaA, LysR family [Phaeobacter inhibens]AXT24878.1 LysR family transcriptional regulator [Phaeobacter inhibens]
MDISQLKTFVTVAREGSITRASELLFRSQPAVSAHIKTMEDTLGLTLFQRTPRGMSVTTDGQRLLVEARQLLDNHQKFLEEASRLRGRLAGQLRVGAGRNLGSTEVSRLLADLSKNFPDLEVALQHGTSSSVLDDIRNGRLDAGFFIDPDEAHTDLETLEISHFSVYLAAAPDLVSERSDLDWTRLETLPWIYPTYSSCCGRIAERLFKENGIQPARIINVDDETITRTLIASGAGIGLVHVSSAGTEPVSGDIALLLEVRKSTRVLFAHLASRAKDPIISAVRDLLNTEQMAIPA